MVRALIVAAVCLAPLHAPAAAAQPLTKIEFSIGPRSNGARDVVQFGLRYSDEQGKHDTSGPRAIRLLSGLTRADLDASSARSVNFSLSNDVGVLTCLGVVTGGLGRGNCFYRPLPEYSRAIRALGISAPTASEHLNLMWQGATVDYARSMNRHVRDLNSPNRLLLLAIHDISPRFVQALASLGYDRLTVDELVNLEVHDVDVDYVHRIRSQGQHPTPDELVLRRMADRS